MPSIVDRVLAYAGRAYRNLAFAMAKNAGVLPTGWVERDATSLTADGKTEIQPSDIKLAEEYRRSLWVYACVSKKARYAGGMPFLLKRARKGTDEVVNEHEALDVLWSPAPKKTWSRLAATMVVNMELSGRAYLEKANGSGDEEGVSDEFTGTAKQLWPMMPHKMKVVSAPREGVTQFIYTPNLKPQAFDPSRIVYWNAIDPIDEDGGFGAMLPGWVSNLLDRNAREWNRGFFERGAHPDIILKPVPGKQIRAADRERIEKDFVTRNEGTFKGRKPFVLPENVDYEESGTTHREIQFDRLLKLSRSEIMACCPAGTGVLTPSGSVPIEQIKAGDLVLTHRGRFRPVVTPMNRMYSGPLHSIRAWGWNEAEFTEGHRIYTKSIKRNRSHNFKVMDEGDFVPVEHLVPFVGGHGRKSGPALVMPALSEMGMMSGFDLASFSAQSGIPVREVGAFFRPDFQGHKYFMPSVIRLDEDAGWIVGLFLAEGSTTDHQTVFALCDDETKYAERAKNILMGMFSREASIRNKRGSHGMTVVLDSRVAAKFFRTFGHESSEKKLPDWWRFAPESFLRGVFRGVLDGDGHRNPTKHNDKRWVLTTTSKHLLWQMRMIGWTIGYSSSYCVRRQCKYRIKQQSGRVYEGMRKASFSCLFSQSDRFAWRKSSGDFLSPMRQNNARQVSEIKVYNLSVQEDESYVTEAGAVHNCFHVPPVLLGLLEDAAYATAWIQLTVFRDYEMIPLMDDLFAVLGENFLADFEDGADLYLEVDREAMLSQEERKGLYELANGSIQTGLLSLDEARELVGKGPKVKTVAADGGQGAVGEGDEDAGIDDEPENRDAELMLADRRRHVTGTNGVHKRRMHPADAPEEIGIGV